MSTLTVNLPAEVDPQEALFLLSAKLYERGRLSLGKAAELAGYTTRTFIEMLGKQGIQVIDYPASDLARELED